MACPGYGAETARVHGYHERTAVDVPVDGRRVLVRVRVHWMLCPSGLHGADLPGAGPGRLGPLPMPHLDLATRKHLLRPRPSQDEKLTFWVQHVNAVCAYAW